LIKVCTIVFISLFLSFGSNSIAQTFGFGCLGLSGFYVGISEQHYNADGLNNYINTKAMGNFVKNVDGVDFNLGSGYRIGANFFRAKWDVVFISAKGYFQFYKEEHDAIINSKEQHKFQLNMNQWGFGIDIGIPINSFIDLKIAELGIAYHNSELIQQHFDNNSLAIERKYSPEKARASYFLASGIIIHLIKDYMSVEGTASYNILNINDFVYKIDEIKIAAINDPFSKKGFSGIIQLNISFPF